MTINIDPVIGKLGPLEYRWYGLIMVVAVIVGVWIFSGQLKRRRISRDHAWGIAVIAVPCGVIGARLVHVLDNFHFGTTPDRSSAGSLSVWPSTGSWPGASSAWSSIAAGRSSRCSRCWTRPPLLSPWPRSSAGARISSTATPGDPPLSCRGLSRTLTRARSYRRTCWEYPPTLLRSTSSCGYSLCLAYILLYLLPRFKTDGLAFVSYIGFYSLGRFFISFYRVNNIIFLGMREAQLLAVAGVVLAAVAGYLLVRRAKNRGVLRQAD